MKSSLTSDLRVPLSLFISFESSDIERGDENRELTEA